MSCVLDGLTDAIVTSILSLLFALIEGVSVRWSDPRSERSAWARVSESLMSNLKVTEVRVP